MLSTTERGYGFAHARRREDLLPDAIGQLCAYCNFEMKIGQALDLDHSEPEARRRGEPGDRIVHSGCNRAGRAYVGEMASAVRSCEICGTTYASRSRETRTCSRACGVELKRRNRPPRPIKAPPALRASVCSECGTSFETQYPHKKTCSLQCSRVRMRRWEDPKPTPPRPLRQSACKECGQPIPFTGMPGRPKALCTACRASADYQPTT